jgi:hypothetical protein
MRRRLCLCESRGQGKAAVKLRARARGLEEVVGCLPAGWLNRRRPPGHGAAAAQRHRPGRAATCAALCYAAQEGVHRSPGGSFSVSPEGVSTALYRSVPWGGHSAEETLK